MSAISVSSEVISAFPPVRQDERYGLRKVLPRFLLRSALSIGPRDFSTVSDAPLAIALKDRSKLIVHALFLILQQYTLPRPAV